jgi:hypothetical protein
MGQHLTAIHADAGGLLGRVECAEHVRQANDAVHLGSVVGYDPHAVCLGGPARHPEYNVTKTKTKTCAQPAW